MPFNNPIVAGTALVRTAIKSPDYVPGVSGWSINRDGTAEFQSATIRGDVSFSSITDGTLDGTGTFGAGGLQAVDVSGSKVVLNAAGLQAFDAAGNQTINLDASTGVGTFTGNLSVINLATQDTLASLDDTGALTAIDAFLSDDVFVEGLALTGTAASSPNIPRVPGSSSGGGGIIDSLPYGLVSYGPFLVGNGTVVAAGGTQGLVSQSFQAEAGRMYVIELTNLWVVASGTGGYHQLNMRWNTPTFNGDQSAVSPSVGAGGVAGFDLHSNSGSVAQHKCFSKFGPYICGPGGDIPFSGLVQLILDLGAFTSNITYQQPNSGRSYQAYCNVYDVGPVIGATSGFLANKGPGGSQSPTQNYSKTYVCSSSQTYDGSNNPVSFYGNEMNQGYYSSGGYGRRSAMAIFPNMTADLTGATITGMSVTIHNHHTYYNDGATVEIGLHGNTSLPATFNVGVWPVITASIAKGATRTFAIPSTYWAGFQSGTYRGINLHAPSDSLSYYSRYDGAGYAYPPKINVTYTK